MLMNDSLASKNKDKTMKNQKVEKEVSKPVSMKDLGIKVSENRPSPLKASRPVKHIRRMHNV